MTTTADLLDEYGSALRGAWGSIDGRSEKIALAELSASIRTYGHHELMTTTVQRLRDALGVCANGGGHWVDFCEDYECSVEDT